MARKRIFRECGPNRVRVLGSEMPIRDRIEIGHRIYLILDELGCAGRKRYMALDPHAGPSGALRAILVLPDSRRGRQHANVLDQISRNNGALPKVFDFRARRGELFVVMEWVKGIDLQAYLAGARVGQRPRPSPVEAVRLIRRLAHDLGQIHRKRRIAHGDIKPSNLIVGSEPTRLVLIDFGNAWLLEHTAQRDPGDGVSAAYAAPELQSTHKRFVDVRCDQFSCGVVLYELLTLVVPYEGLGGQAASLATRGLVQASKLSSHAGQIPRSAWSHIDTFLETSLSFAPDGRYPTPKAWLDAIDTVYDSLRLRHPLGRLNAKLTRVIDWIGALWRSALG
jgi:serine/threonine protein kinase